MVAKYDDNGQLLAGGEVMVVLADGMIAYAELSTGIAGECIQRGEMKSKEDRCLAEFQIKLQ